MHITLIRFYKNMDLGSKQSSWLFAHNKFKADVFSPVCFIAILIFYQLFH